MAEKHKHLSSSELSYALYNEIAEDLCEAVDTNLSLELRFELYLSKLIYLQNIHSQCFKLANSPLPGFDTTVARADLEKIAQTVMITKQFLRETVLESLHFALTHAKNTEQRARGLRSS